MADASAEKTDPRLGRILYAFEPPALFQMVAGLIGAALGWLLFSVWGDFLKRLTLTIVGLGSFAFLVGLWRFSEQVEFGERGVRRHKWGGSRELLYEEIAAVVHLGSDSEQQYSKLRLEPLAETGKSAIQFYRFEGAGFPQAEQIMTSALADRLSQRLARGEVIVWLPGVNLRREGLEIAADDRTQPTVIPYSQIGPWETGDRGVRILRHRQTRQALLSVSLNSPNCSVIRELMARLAGPAPA